MKSMTLLAGAATLAMTSMAHAGLSLTIDGNCPGGMTARVSGATPNRQVAFLYGGCGGPTRIGSGACSGTLLDLSRPRVLRFVLADVNGDANLLGDAGQGACGLVCLQAVDVATCRVTNRVGI